MEGYSNKERRVAMKNNILDKLEKLIQDSARKRTSFLIAITKSSRSISEGANKWFESETRLLKQEMEILDRVMHEEVEEWENQLNIISLKFKKAISYLNKVIERAEQGKLTTLGEVYPSKKTTFPPTPEPVEEIKSGISEEYEYEEERKLTLVSAILEVLDAASTLEKLIDEVERESKRTIRTAKLVKMALDQVS